MSWKAHGTYRITDHKCQIIIICSIFMTLLNYIRILVSVYPVKTAHCWWTQNAVAILWLYWDSLRPKLQLKRSSLCWTNSVGYAWFPRRIILMTQSFYLRPSKQTPFPPTPSSYCPAPAFMPYPETALRAGSHQISQVYGKGKQPAFDQPSWPGWEIPVLHLCSRHLASSLTTE